jgi:hypothetical protein
MRASVIILALMIFIGNTLANAVAPVPEAAKGVSIPQDKGYFVEEIKDGLYWVTEGAYTAMFLSSDQRASNTSPSDCFCCRAERVTCFFR